MRIIFLSFVSVFLLSSCMTIDSKIDIASTGRAKSDVILDMSRMITVLSAFGTGTDATSIDKNLCKDKNFSEGLSEGQKESGGKIENFQCTSLGDYRARIE